MQVGLGGPTVTNVDVTSHWQFYSTGVFYNEGQCDSYQREQVGLTLIRDTLVGNDVVIRRVAQ